MVYRVGIFDTITGSPELYVPVSDAQWTTRLNSKGTGRHIIPVRRAGIPRTLIRELSTGNKYTIAQCWDDYAAYAGVIQDRSYSEKTGLLTIQSKELRAALLGWRLFWSGVSQYDPYNGKLQIVNKSYDGALRAVVTSATRYGGPAEDHRWQLPIDRTPDTAGTFNALWEHDQVLTAENLMTQIEEDGAEIAFIQYLTSDGYLRWKSYAQPKVVVGSPFMINATAKDSPVTDLQVREDTTTLLTGTLGFGEGSGADRPFKYATLDSAEVWGTPEVPFKDQKVEFPDIEKEETTRLQNATNNALRSRAYPIEQWSFSLNIERTGPAGAGIGNILDLHTYKSAFMLDGPHPQRVIAVNGTHKHIITPEVQSYG